MDDPNDKNYSSSSNLLVHTSKYLWVNQALVWICFVIICNKIIGMNKILDVFNDKCQVLLKLNFQLTIQKSTRKIIDQWNHFWNPLCNYLLLEFKKEWKSCRKIYELLKVSEQINFNLYRNCVGWFSKHLQTT